VRPDHKLTKLFDLSAVPAKAILKNKAAVCPPLPALCEIFDNIFDNYDENGAARDLTISVIFSTVRAELSIGENSGGIPRAKLNALITLGIASHSTAGAIGVWGEGLKVGAFALGDEVEILTSYRDEPPISIHFEPGWLDVTEWSVPIFSIASDAIARGTSQIVIRHLHREIEWTDVIREIGVVYGHKIQTYSDRGRKVRIEFEIDGSRTQARPRPLASEKELRHRMTYPPEFAPRWFSAEWTGHYGPVNCRLLVGLTPRHSGETSGVYLYGNGRLFARHLRSRAVGYGESGNSILRDHPSCWRIHAYGFFEADHGADIPWQAPLKDGLSENHPITARFRDMFKQVVAPYSKFAKVAKASEVVPYTLEWAEMSDHDRAEVLFGRDTPDAVARFKSLPGQFRKFAPPSTIETLHFDGAIAAKLLYQLDEYASFARQVLARRDKDGQVTVEEVLRSFNPRLFETMRARQGTTALFGPASDYQERQSSSRYRRTSKCAF
jgi:Histidine kinase-, DNA gyrase B-, and HSP90-like ATPase